MNCQDVSLILDDRDIRQLSVSEQKSVEAHLASCRECADAWRVHRQAVSRTIPEMPGDLQAGIWRVLEATQPATSSRRPLRRPLALAGLLLVGAAAATIVAIQLNDQPQEAEGLIVDTVGERSVEPATTGRDMPALSDDAEDTQPEVANENETGTLESTGASISLDLASVAVLPVTLINTDSESVLAAANDVRADIIRRLDESDELNLIDPALVESYVDSGLADVAIGQTLGVGTLIFVRGERDDGRVTIRYGTLDPATDMELYYGTVGLLGDSLPAGAVRVNELNAANLIERLTLAAYPDLAVSAAQSIQDNQAIALNAGLSDDERVSALAELRNLGPDARNDAVVAAAVDIALNSDDPMIRNRTWFALSDLHDPSLVEPLLNALRYDSSEIVRGVAVRLLGKYADEPGVRPALEYAATWDADPGIRESAAIAAMSDPDRYAAARTSFFDRTLEADQRINALTSYFGSIGPGLRIDPDVADELFEIELDPTVGTTWAGTLLFYAEDLDPKFIDPLLALLADEPEHRAFAASVLHHFSDQPAVIEALERALEDPDRNVRNNAQLALERGP